MQTTSSMAELTLFNGTSTDEVDIALRVTSAGPSVGVGTNTPSEELYVVGDITATGTISELSSAKYKTNINQLDNALDMVDNLRGVKFNWRAKDYPNMRFSEDQQVGLVAEEVETVIPELVHADNNGVKSVDYSKLTAVLVEAIKELKAENEELRTRMEALEKGQ